jgi:radical SAM protein with 4Fe4S-binding SPASM domain
MRARVRWKYLARSPSILWNLLLAGRYDFTFDLMPMQATGMSAAKRLNLLKAGMNLLYRRARPWAMPIHMQVELTNFCPLRCPVCPVGRGLLNRPPRQMDLNLYERLMAEVGPYLLTVLLWAWGEPLMHRDFSSAVRIARRHGVLPILSTNGEPLGNPRVRQALLAEPPEYLIVAIDGLRPETHRQYRVGSDLQAVLAGVRALAEAKRSAGRSLPRLHMRYIVMKHNQHEVPDVGHFASEHGFDLLTIRGLSIIDDEESFYRRLAPDRKDFQSYRYQGPQRVLRSDFLCQHAFNLPAVFVDGTVVACDQDFNASHPYGRLDEGRSFRDLWYGAPARRLRGTIRDRRMDLSFCRNCPYADRPINTCSLQRMELSDTEAMSVS